ncbi:MAG: Nif3-like dinuclear metal center hexameric protein [Planctomycetes bacterium]|nr:Nif3-like dinuclear metal center hexameric protein [Planctomycetota bacterium]
MPSAREERRRPAPRATVAEVYTALDELAPFAGAEDWDNVGLLAGRPEWPARRVLIALDLTDAVAREALRRQVDTLVVYHPPIFKGIRTVTPQAECPTALLPDLLAARIAILAAHTALDVAVGGTNDLLLDLFEPVSRRPLEPSIRQSDDFKLVVFVPPTEVNELRSALSAAGAGMIGHYSECSFELAGRGTFRGDETTRPAIGRRRVLESVAEIRLEMVVPRRSIGRVVRVLYATHSYEEPAFDLYRLQQVTGRGRVGMGRVGELKRPQRGTALARMLAKGVDLSVATCVGDLRRRFRSVTVGAGTLGISRFRDPDSLVVTGELKHHDALELLRRGVTAICLGHYASERLVLAALRKGLSGVLKVSSVTIARSDRSPFQPIRA